MRCHNDVVLLFCCKIHCADTKGESAEGGLSKSGLFEYPHHFLSLREGLNRLCKIGVGPLVFRDEPSIYGEKGVRVNPEELAHGEVLRSCQFDNT